MPSGRGRGQGKGRGRGRSQNRGVRNSPSHSHERSNSQNQSHGQCNSQQGGHQHQHAHGQRYDKSNVQCHYCKKYGHYANECRKKQNDMKNRQNANVAKEEKKPSNVMLACNVAQDREDDVWFLDSGCSNHMTGNKAIFSNLDEEIKSEVTTGTDTKISVKGKGRVSIRARNGEQKFVPDVYYVPGLKCNLLSVGQLINKGYNVIFKDDVCTIKDIPPSKKIIAKIQMTNNRMFPLKLNTDLKGKVRIIAAVFQESFQKQAKYKNWLCT